MLSAMEVLLGNWLVTGCVVLLVWLILKCVKFTRPRMKDLHDKAVLITGCDSGFGHDLAKRLDTLGVTVYAGVLFPDGDGAAKLKQSCSSRIQILHLDVTKDEDVAEAVKTVSATLGNKKLWSVVNNAGIATYGGFEWTPMETTKKIVDVNVFGPVRITTAFLPLLKESHGRVVIVASLAGHHSFPGMCAYNMSKHAIVAFGDTIRRELRNWSVSVHLIKPHLYRTNIANPEVLHKELTRSWESSNKNKSSYPSTYLSYFEKSLPVLLTIGKSPEKIYEVVDDMEDAAIGLYPKISYLPGTTAKVHHALGSILPSSIVDFLSGLVLPPTREGERNKLLDYLYTTLCKNEKEIS